MNTQRSKELSDIINFFDKLSFNDLEVLFVKESCYQNGTVTDFNKMESEVKNNPNSNYLFVNCLEHDSVDYYKINKLFENLQDINNNCFFVYLKKYSFNLKILDTFYLK
jgi:hypothetical protein